MSQLKKSESSPQLDKDAKSHSFGSSRALPTQILNNKHVKKFMKAAANFTSSSSSSSSPSPSSSGTNGTTPHDARHTPEKDGHESSSNVSTPPQTVDGGLQLSVSSESIEPATSSPEDANEGLTSLGYGPPPASSGDSPILETMLDLASVADTASNISEDDRSDADFSDTASLVSIAEEEERPTIITDNDGQVKAATLERLVERATSSSVADPSFLLDLLLTYRSFTTPARLFESLTQRYDPPPTTRSASNSLSRTNTPTQIVRTTTPRLIRSSTPSSLSGRRLTPQPDRSRTSSVESNASTGSTSATSSGVEGDVTPPMEPVSGKLEIVPEMREDKTERTLSQEIDPATIKKLNDGTMDLDLIMEDDYTPPGPEPSTSPSPNTQSPSSSTSSFPNGSTGAARPSNTPPSTLSQPTPIRPISSAQFVPGILSSSPGGGLSTDPPSPSHSPTPPSSIPVRAVPTSTSRENLNDQATNKHLFAIRSRVFNVLRTWVSNYWIDFTSDPALLSSLNAFVQETMSREIPAHASQITKLVAKKQADGDGDASTASTKSSKAPCSLLAIQTYNAQEADIQLQMSLIASDPRRFDVWGYHPIEIAKQITLLQASLFSSIKPWEFFNQRWSKKDSATLAPNIIAMIRQFNHLSQWVTHEILRCPDLDRRSQLLIRMVEVAIICSRMHNYNGMMSIVSGLQSSSVHRLRKSWAALSPKSLEVYTQLAEMVSGKNYASYRAHLRNATPPCIPYLGVYLTDLTFLEDGNADEFNGLIHFAKCRRVSKVLREIILYQQTPYDFRSVPLLQTFFREVTKEPRDLSKAYDLSLGLEPRGTLLPPFPSIAPNTTDLEHQIKQLVSIMNQHIIETQSPASPQQSQPASISAVTPSPSLFSMFSPTASLLSFSGLSNNKDANSPLSLSGKDSSSPLVVTPSTPSVSAQQAPSQQTPKVEPIPFSLDTTSADESKSGTESPRPDNAPLDNNTPAGTPRGETAPGSAPSSSPSTPSSSSPSLMSTPVAPATSTPPKKDLASDSPPSPSWSAAVPVQTILSLKFLLFGCRGPLAIKVPVFFTAADLSEHVVKYLGPLLGYKAGCAVVVVPTLAEPHGVLINPERKLKDYSSVVWPEYATQPVLALYSRPAVVEVAASVPGKGMGLSEARNVILDAASPLAHMFPMLTAVFSDILTGEFSFNFIEDGKFQGEWLHCARSLDDQGIKLKGFVVDGAEVQKKNKTKWLMEGMPGMDTPDTEGMLILTPLTVFHNKAYPMEVRKEGALNVVVKKDKVSFKKSAAKRMHIVLHDHFLSVYKEKDQPSPYFVMSLEHYFARLVVKKKGSVMYITRLQRGIPGGEINELSIKANTERELRAWYFDIQQYLSQKHKITHFGISLNDLCDSPSSVNKIPSVLYHLTNFLFIDALLVQDLFALAPKPYDVLYLQRAFDTTNQHQGILRPDSKPHAVAQLLLVLLDSLPIPVLTYELYDWFIIFGNRHLAMAIEYEADELRMLVELLPPHHASVLHFLLYFMRMLSEENMGCRERIPSAFGSVMLKNPADLDVQINPTGSASEKTNMSLPAVVQIETVIRRYMALQDEVFSKPLNVRSQTSAALVQIYSSSSVSSQSAASSSASLSSSASFLGRKPNASGLSFSSGSVPPPPSTWARTRSPSIADYHPPVSMVAAGGAGGGDVPVSLAGSSSTSAAVAATDPAAGSPSFLKNRPGMLSIGNRHSGPVTRTTFGSHRKTDDVPKGDV
eukprot:TRINITY_DN3099_c0_g1_i3.p1 TRINITY_DN3099_c0_g1~~TRINITY_DN3099_c0_g1_i3.p1  ORF type:complete len:1734 (-),score=473.54 TRINITY_DN3099_c0_g1_i3:56-5257(-)